MNLSGQLTIKDIANMAGVSISTVSRAINNSGPVNEKTKNKILKIIEETQFSPNGLARGLRTSTKTIGLLIPDITNLFFIELVKGIEHILDQKGYSALLFNTDWDSEKEIRYLNLMEERRVEGVIFMATFLSYSTLQLLPEKDIRVVSIQNGVKGVDSIFTKDGEGAFEATEHLINLGHKRIAFVGFKNITDCMNNRLSGYEMALMKHGIEVDKAYQLFCQPHGDYGYEIAQELFKLPQLPTAVIAISDHMAAGIFRAFEERGIKVPDDVSVIGFDNTHLCQWLHPKLTTVAQPIFEMGKTAASLLLERIANGSSDDEVEREITLPTKLIVRGSTAKVRQG